MPALQAKIYFEVAEAANRMKADGAYRLFILAKTIDQAGRGVVLAPKLRTAGRKAGVSRKTQKRWMDQAIELGLVKRGKHNTNAIILCSMQAAAIVFDVGHVGSRPAIVPIDALLAEGWRAVVWAAYLRINHQGKHISQKKLRDLTGVPERTQRELNRQAGIETVRKGIGVSKHGADELPGMQEHGNVLDRRVRPSLFQWHDRKTHTDRVAYPLPAKRRVSDAVAVPGHLGRTKKINAYLKNHLDGLCTLQRATIKTQARKILAETLRQAQRGYQASRKVDGPDNETYLRHRGPRVAGYSVFDIYVQS